MMRDGTFNGHHRSVLKIIRFLQHCFLSSAAAFLTAQRPNKAEILELSDSFLIHARRPRDSLSRLLRLNIKAVLCTLKGPQNGVRRCCRECYSNASDNDSLPAYRPRSPIQGWVGTSTGLCIHYERLDSSDMIIRKITAKQNIPKQLP